MKIHPSTPKCKCFECHFSEEHVRNPIIAKPVVWDPIITIFSLRVYGCGILGIFAGEAVRSKLTGTGSLFIVLVSY